MNRIGDIGCRPYVVGIGGTTRHNSGSEKAVRCALKHAEEAGAETRMFAGPDILFPIYDPARTDRTEAETAFVEALRKADGIILASPGYHGSISGHLKNALDYTQDMYADNKAYFSARAVGCIGVAAGWQAAQATLGTLRDIVHALRGWPTPLGITINSAGPPLFDDDANCLDDDLDGRLRYLARQVVVFGVMRFTARAAYPDWELWPETGEYFPKVKIERAEV